MTQQPIRFDDGAAYERGMGGWSRIVGEAFLDWIGPEDGWHWADIGCGSGAFSALVTRCCAPGSVHGIDPSEAQLAFARGRSDAAGADFRQGDAMALPWPDNRFDAAVMALVIFFVPDPAKGVAEMARVVRPGGTVAAYAWDMPEGFPFYPVQAELRAMGIVQPLPPSVDASRLEAMAALWRAAGLEAIETRYFEPQRTFGDFEEFWRVSTSAGGLRATLSAMAPADVDALRDRVRARLPIAADGRIVHTARANAIKGRVR